MNSKSKPVTRLKINFQPMPMKELLANIQALPVDLTESSDDDSFGSYVKNTKPAFTSKWRGPRDRNVFDRVHVMPTIEASESTNPGLSDGSTRPPVLEKRKTDRCLFPELEKDKTAELCPSRTTNNIDSQQKPAKDSSVELCPSGTTYNIENQQKLAKDSSVEPCLMSTANKIVNQEKSAKDASVDLCLPGVPTCSVDNQQKSAKETSFEMCPPGTTFTVDNQQKSAKETSFEMCPPGTTFTVDNQQKSAKETSFEICPSGTTYNVDNQQKSAKETSFEICPPGTTYNVDNQQKSAKETSFEICPPGTTFTVDNQQKSAKETSFEICPPGTTYNVDNQQKSAKETSVHLCPPNTTCNIVNQQKPAKDILTHLCPPSSTHVLRQQEPAKDKAAKPCPPSIYDINGQHKQKEKAAKLCPPSSVYVHKKQEPAREKAADPCPPNNTPFNKSAMVPVTPTQPQTKTSTIQYKTISIKGKKYMFMAQIGSGGSSYVYKVLEIATSNEYALKSVNLSTDPEVSQGYLNEVRVLRELQASDRVVKLYAYEHVKAAFTLNLLLELGETSLAMFLRRHCEGAPPALVLHYWEEMLLAVQQIHAHGIVHADLKPANFLLVSGTLKLIDFGIASKVSSDATSVERTFEKGTFSYISPEALGGDGSHPFKVSFYSDVWSLGCILYSLVYGQTPFANYSNAIKIMTIKDSKHRISYPRADHVPASLLSVMKQCLRYRAHDRPTVAEMLKLNHIIQHHQGIPAALLDKLRPHVTPREFTILESARVTAEAISYAET